MAGNRKIRVLVIDDSIVMRKMLVMLFNEQPDMEVVGEAADGAEGVEKVRRLKPDVITLDILMPGVGGLEALKRIREFDREVSIIVFCVTTTDRATYTLEALERGATDYLPKPSRVREMSESLEVIRSQLIPKVRSRVAPESAPRSRPQLSPPPSVAPSRRKGSGRIVTIGVSTGGPEALAKLLPQLPADYGLPILIVQHMPDVFIRYLHRRLTSLCRIRVEVATDGRLLEPGVALLGPGDLHLTVEGRPRGARVRLDRGAPENSCRPSVDVLFRSAAATHGPLASGVILTGMGRDGLDGARALHEAGAMVMVQDEATSVVWGMPGVVAEAGLAHLIGSPETIARALMDIARGELPGTR